MKRIIGSRFHSIYRVLDMLCLNIGKDVQADDDVTVEFSFHIQTQWRLYKGEKILVASRDVYIPSDPTTKNEDWEYDVVGRNDGESSVFDVASRALAEEFGDATVTAVEVNVFGDLRIEFSNSIVFETFTPSSVKDEEWRFISAYDKEHFVVFDTL